MSHTSGHLALKFFGGIITLFIFLFVSQVVYYLWQFRYGDAETLRTITTTYENQFTKASDTDAPQAFTDFPSLVRNHNPTIGSTQAPITLTAFIDFGCPYSQENYPIFTYIKEQFDPAVRVVFKHLPLTQIHPNALPAALASTCAQEQNKFWEYHDRLFATKQLSQDALFSHAQSIGLNMEQFNTCFTSQRYMNRIQDDIEDALKVGIRGTPTLLINEDIVEGVATREDWNKLILSHLND